MTTPVSRRGALVFGIAALAGCLSNPRERRSPTEPGEEPTNPPATTATTSEPGCGTPVAQEWGSREETPSVPACPEKPGVMDPCSARAFAIGLEKHRQYVDALGRHETISAIEFYAYRATVTGTESGYIVSARLYFSADEVRETSGTKAAERTDMATTGTRTRTQPSEGTTEPARPTTGVYYVTYLVTPDRQWRAADYSQQFRTAEAIRDAGSIVTCVDGA